MTAKRTMLLLAAALMFGLLITVLSSCAAPYLMEVRDATDAVVAPEEMDRPYPVEEHVDEYAAERGEPDRPVEVTEDGRVGETALRHVIRSGSISLSVIDTRETMNDVRSIVENAEGLVSDSYVYEIREGRYGASMTLRVPEKRFDTVMNTLEELGKATNIETRSEDVTMEYVDLESRLNNQKAQEERLIEILDKAETVEEILEVERELHRVRGEIESMTARLNRLEDQVSYATINLNLREEAVPTGSVSPGAFENLSTRMGEAFIGSVNFILNALSVLIVAMSAILPVLIILFVIAIVIWLLVRRIIKRRTAGGETIEKEQEA